MFFVKAIICPESFPSETDKDQCQCECYFSRHYNNLFFSDLHSNAVCNIGWGTLIVLFKDRVPKVYSKNCNAMTKN